MFGFVIVSEANQTKHDTLRRGAICANFETLGSKFSQRD